MEENDLCLRKLAGRDAMARKKTEARPSTFVEESARGNPRLEYAQQKHSIFLSHSGAQKAFVRRLRNALERNGYHPFFDEDPDCLPKGEPFAQRIKDTCRLADVAVVVVSDEFVQSKWPMIELTIFIQEQELRRMGPGECKELKVLPLFMGLSVEEFRDADRRSCWLGKWNEIRATDERIDVSEWENALKVIGGINGLQYYKYRNEEEYTQSVVSAIFNLVCPNLMWEGTEMKGKSKIHQDVVGMFASSPSRTRFHQVRAIGLYGIGGIGKTTICKSLCNDYLAKFNGKVWYAELGKKSKEEIQMDVLHQLHGMSEAFLNKSANCKGQLRSLLRRKMDYKVFLAIDNVWNEDDSREQAEALLEMGFHPDSLVMVASRSREVLEWLGIEKGCCFEMPGLDRGDATALLMEYAAPGCDVESLALSERVAVDRVVERCLMTKGPICGAGSEKQYVPLALRVLGRQLRLPLCGTTAELRKWVDELDLKWCKQKQHPIFSILGLSYENLGSSKHRNMFLDVGLCVPRQEDNTSASVDEVCKWLSMVYSEDVAVVLKILKDLVSDGLVERWHDMASPLGMHELYCEFAKSEVSREGRLEEKTYLYQEDGRHVPAMMLKRRPEKDSWWAVRRIHMYNGGFSELSSRELKHMENVEVLKLDFCFELELLDLRCLKSVVSVELRGCFQLQTVEGLEELGDLRFFRWNTCRNSIVVGDFPVALEILEIYGSKESEVVDRIGCFEKCCGLRELTLSGHPVLVAWWDFSELQKLEKVNLSGCCRIEEVRGLGTLGRLRHLNLEGCKKLRHCKGVEELASVETVNLGGCESLSVPVVWVLRRLVKLRLLVLSGVSSVYVLVLWSAGLEQLEVRGCSSWRKVELPTIFGSWKFLSYLNEQRRCEDDNPVPWSVDVDCGSSFVAGNGIDEYESLNLSNCRRLESLGDIGLLRSLKYLYLRKCSTLKALPDLSNLLHLKVVDLSHCYALEELGGFWYCRALEWLSCRECRSLLGMGSLCAPLLKVLDLSGCRKLESLCEFDLMRSLQMLDLSECVSLTTVPDLSECPFLEALNVKGCVELHALPEMSTDNVVIEISEGGKLGDIPILDVVASLHLDMAVSGNRENEPYCKGLEGSKIIWLKLFCHRYSELRYRDADRLGQSSVLSGIGFYVFPTPDWSSASDYHSDYHNIRDKRNWLGRGYDTCPDPVYFRSFVRVSSLSIVSCGDLTEFPRSALSSNLSRLEIIKCRNLRSLSNLTYLPTLETLVISECEELESLPGLRTASALKHLTIRGFRQGPHFEFLHYLTPTVCGYAKTKRAAMYNFKNLVELTFDGCVGLGGLYHWGPLPALESVVIKDCHSVCELPDLRSSPKLSSVVVMNCGKLREGVDTGCAKALRMLRIEGCTNEEFIGTASRERLRCEIENALGRDELCLDLDWGKSQVLNPIWSTFCKIIRELISWLREAEEDGGSDLDVFTGLFQNLSRIFWPERWLNRADNRVVLVKDFLAKCARNLG